MDQQRVCESIARQLADVWAIHRTPAFVNYLQQTFGCEPRESVRFAGIFSLQMIGGYFFPDVPAGPGPVIERLWLTDDKGFRAISMDELLSTEGNDPLAPRLESDNPLVIYDRSSGSCEPISSQPSLFVYPRFLFCVRGDEVIFIESFGYCAWCRKVGKVIVGDGVQIKDTHVLANMWQGCLVTMA